MYEEGTFTRYSDGSLIYNPKITGCFTNGSRITEPVKYDSGSPWPPANAMVLKLEDTNVKSCWRAYEISIQSLHAGDLLVD